MPAMLDSGSVAAVTPVATSTAPAPNQAASSVAAGRQNMAAVQRAVNRIRAAVASAGHTLDFQVDKLSGLVVVTVKDTATGDVIRRIPGNAILQAADSLESDADAPAALVDLKA